MNTMEIYDVAIVGGGLAGLSVAIQCADAGYKVILFEKEQYPFHKLCGEYISMESYNFLQRLGFNFSQFDIPKINTLQLSDVKGNLYEFSLPLGGFGISRYTLDHALYNIAKSKAVTVLENTKVQDIIFGQDKFEVHTSGNSYSAKIVSAAYGKRSNLDIKWKRDFVQTKANKLNNYIGVKYHVRFSYPKDHIALHNFSNGYCGISNVDNNTCCVCYLTTASNLAANNNSIKKMEENILWQNPHLKKIFSTAAFLYKEPLTISQISFEKKSQVENHILLAGDAAGLITPLCGNGMSMAMHASLLAFENINRFLQGNISRKEMETEYIKAWQQQFSKRLFIGRTVQKIFEHNSSTSFFLRSMHAMPFIAKQVIKATHGRSF